MRSVETTPPSPPQEVITGVTEAVTWRTLRDANIGPPGQGIDILFCTDPDGTMMEIAGPVKG